ncbi:hypothetical protein ACQEVF_02230 [Nonomuraea polychroma]|uniref:hypothetical protein n=1 Tax=Nonomuraea polychroma TaxID=46176 RepID=UPI003D8CB611
MLDGLDELPDYRRDRVVKQLNEQLDRDGFILTCRTEQFRQAIQADVLTAAAVIESVPLSGKEVADYMVSCLRPDPGGSWSELVRRLRDPADRLPFRPRRDWPAEAVHRWLTEISLFLDDSDSRDLGWWDLHLMASWTWIKTVLGLAVGLVIGVPAGVGFWLWRPGGQRWSTRTSML